MCGGVYYASNGGDIRFYFPNPEAQRPGGIQLLAWGRRPGKAGKLPLGGWARLNSIDEGRWDRWFPIPVKMPLKCFMEQDIEGHNRWHDLAKGPWVQGLIARHRHERRVYVVTVEPEQPDAIAEAVIGARSRSRTGTVLPPRDFKSLASTNFATRAIPRGRILQWQA